MDEHKEDRNGSSTPETLPAAVPDTDIILQAIKDTREDVARVADQLTQVERRLESAESVITELPTIYASAEAVKRVAASQAEYEASRQRLTVQVGELANLLVDNQNKFTTIEARMNEFSPVKTKVDGMATKLDTLVDSLDTFMQTQRERLDNQQVAITEARQKTDDLTKEVALVKTTFNPVRDFVVGSDTHKPLMVVMDGIDSRLNTMAQQLTPAVEYITEQKKREAERRSFWQTVRLNMYTPRGVFAAMLFIVVMLMVINSINFDQLGERIRQFAAAIELLRNAVSSK